MTPRDPDDDLRQNIDERIAACRARGCWCGDGQGFCPGPRNCFWAKLWYRDEIYGDEDEEAEHEPE